MIRRSVNVKKYVYDNVQTKQFYLCPLIYSFLPSLIHYLLINSHKPDSVSFPVETIF
jgi:hypothetical protein